MELKKGWIITITLGSFIFLIVLDFINITEYFNYSSNVESTISNIITFISILIGFISTIYIMIQQSQNSSYIYSLLRKKNLIIVFNNSFKAFTFIGFIDVAFLIFLNYFSNVFTLFKYTLYIVFPLTVYFILLSNNLISTIIKMVIAEEQLKQQTYVLQDKDINI